MSTYNEIATGGIELAGLSKVPFQSLSDFQGDTVGSRCVTHGTASFCCAIDDARRTVTWLKIKDAYLPAISVCGQRLY